MDTRVRGMLIMHLARILDQTKGHATPERAAMKTIMYALIFGANWADIERNLLRTLDDTN